MTTEEQPYITDEAHGDNWTMLLGDSCERLAEIETNSIDMSVCSPPFDSLYTYSPSTRDLGNSASRVEFLEHYKFIIREQLRVTKPGRLACIHVQQITTKKSVDGVIGLTDFRGDVIRAFQEEGWTFWAKSPCGKTPKLNQSELRRNSSHSRQRTGIAPASARHSLTTCCCLRSQGRTR